MEDDGARGGLSLLGYGVGDEFQGCDLVVFAGEGLGREGRDVGEGVGGVRDGVVGGCHGC